MIRHFPLASFLVMSIHAEIITEMLGADFIFRININLE